MEVYQALILGIVQGLTELLPISSSAHFEIIKWIFEWEIPEAFDVALHFGTLLAIVIYFFKDWLELIKGGFKYVVKKEKTVQGRMFWYIVLATIPGGIIGFILDTFFSDVLDIPWVIATALIVMGIVLYFVDKKCKSETEYEQMTLKQTFFLFLSQALAFIPGVSRSGVTMTTARALGVKREAAAKYSFLLSTPIVFAATVYKFKDFVFDLPFIIGVLASFIVGIFVIKFLLKYLQKGSFKGFAIYRVIAGILIILIACIKAFIQ